MKPLHREDDRRIHGQHFVRGSPLAYREKLEALWRADPTLPLVEAAKRTGASRNVAQTVKRRLRDAGRIP